MRPRLPQDGIAARLKRATEDNAIGATYVQERAKVRYSFGGPGDSMLQERVENLEEDIENLTQKIASASTADRSKRLPGRPRERNREFVGVAAALWAKAQQAASGKVVSRDQLVGIASEFDKLGFTPPAGYLEPSYAIQVRTFNSKHSKSTAHPPIKTWRQLVDNGDKDHLRGMRKLLSRCLKESHVQFVRK